MIDLTQTLSARIISNKLPEINLGSESVHPCYDGLSLLNLPGSIFNWLGAPALPHPALDIPQLNALADGINQVIVCLVDGLSFHRFYEWAAGFAYFSSLPNDALMAPITSITPSTTSSALTTLWTGRSPIEHGLLGYELFLREYGLVANMITHSPIVTSKPSGQLYPAGFDPENTLHAARLGTLLTQAGIETHAFLNHSIRNSGLSRMHYSDVNIHGYNTVADLWISVQHLVQQPHRQKRFIWCYYPHIDTLSHYNGPDSERVQADFELFMLGLRRFFLESKHSSGRKNTLFLLLADHGQIPTHPDPQSEIHNHPDLIEMLTLFPTGENRLAYFYPRPDHTRAVQQYIHAVWGEEMLCISSAKAARQGLFGPGQALPEAGSRLGEFIAVAQADRFIWFASRPDTMQGRHGGLSAQEMLVPLLALRLD